MSDKSMPDAVMPTCSTRKVLAGQEALVAGESSGIGRAVAIALGQAGADVVVNYGSAEAAAHHLAAEVARFGSRAITYQADVSQEEQVQAMFRRMLDEFGTIDILVNNAGVHKDAPL